MFDAATFCMNTMSLVSVFADSGLVAVGNVVVSLVIVEPMIGEDEDSHVAVFEGASWYDTWDSAMADYEYDYYEHTYYDMEDDERDAILAADQAADQKAGWLAGTFPAMPCPCCGKYR
jgi:hypothetical protein